MRNLINLSKEEICDFLLNNKKGECLELSPEEGTDTGKSGFTNRVVYEDKNMKIVFSFLEIAEDDTIQEFFIYSKWWGQIKNSMFTLQGWRGKSKELLCGMIEVNNLKNWNSGTNHAVNNRNRVADIEVIDFASFAQRCQKVFRGNPNYKVAEVISLSPNPWVKIEVTMPDGSRHEHEGASKKDAANRFAVAYKW